MVRTVMIAAVALAAAGAADGQQRVVMPGPGPGAPYPMPSSGPVSPYSTPPRPGQHWGGRVNGVWAGGARAPGGYAAYRRPYRGYMLSSYWLQPSFTVSDWSLYGLQQPPFGYRWVRYYDDAVLVDRRGAVADTVGGVDWDRYDLDYQGASYDDRRYADSGYAGADYPPPPPPAYAERRSNGVGGALVGGAVGAGAGALIAGRHDRGTGALIGAGVGGVTGYALDRSADRGRYAPPPAYTSPPPPVYAPPPGGYGAGYPVPLYRAHGPYAPPPAITSGGGTTVVTTGGVPGGYYYPGAGVTTITVASAPVVTTTTTEVFEDSVTYTRAATRRVYHRRVYRRVPTCGCRVR